MLAAPPYCRWLARRHQGYRISTSGLATRPSEQHGVVTTVNGVLTVGSSLYIEKALPGGIGLLLASGMRKASQQITDCDVIETATATHWCEIQACIAG